MNQRYRNEGGRSLVAVVLIALVLAMGIAIFVKERSRSAERDAKQSGLISQRAEEEAKAKRAEEERQALEKQAALAAAKRPDPLATSLKSVDDTYARWQDARNVAGSTSRMALSGPLATLQAIRRDAKELTVPPCLERGKTELISGMDFTIDGILVFMQNPAKLGDVLAQEKFESASKHYEAFQMDRAMCPKPIDAGT